MGKHSHKPGGFDRQMKWLDFCMPLVFQDTHYALAGWDGNYQKIAGEELPSTIWLPHLERITDGIYPNAEPHEKAALISFYSQMGYRAIARSTVRMLIDRGQKEEACYHWLKWDLVDDVPVIERQVRRKREVNLYLRGISQEN
jgi:hypothetical protein